MIGIFGFTVGYTVVLFIYGQVVGSPLGSLYAAINAGLIVFFTVLHR
jgi:hypothetical protein